MANAAFHLGLTGPGGWWIIHKPELSLGVDPDYDPVVPDIAGWRLTTMPDRPMAPQFHLVPDGVCEVLSPSTARHDRMLKLPFYARAGVRYAWLVDPILETVEVYRNEGGNWLLAATAAGDRVVTLKPFDAVAMDRLPGWGRRRDSEGD
ncbi:MAG: Uma2 family endonuclease [Myxococcota bacterium]|jgi:Uma2 family endonuclease